MNTLEDCARERESTRLEFKEASSVGDPRILPRAVCAMLNAEGGEVVVGLRETPSGIVPDPVADVDKARVAVRDRLAASIDPLPPPTLEVVVLPGASGAGLRIRVPRGDGLYAFRERRGALSFVRRLGDRVVLLSMPEIRSALSGEETEAERLKRRATEDPEAEVNEELEDWIEATTRQAPVLLQVGGLFLVATVRPRTVRPTEGWDRDLEVWYRDPTSIGIRRHGCHFLHEKSLPARRRGRRGARSSGAWEIGYKVAEYTDRAEFRYAQVLDTILEREPRASDDAPVRIVHQVKLIETIASCMKVFAQMWRDPVDAGATAWIALAITDARGLQLPPYAAGSAGSTFDHFWQDPWEEDRLAPPPERADLTELRRSPDRTAWRLLLRLYRDFGYEEEQLPYYDRDRERFVFE